ncbi:MAG: dihydroorotase [Thermococci archaeon]|nr:dihydroorotase [Thermococci archaeon]
MVLRFEVKERRGIDTELVICGNFAGSFRGCVGVEDGRIARISKGRLRGEQTIELGSGKVVMPGLIDVHVHLRDFKERRKETVRSGTAAALHGGITTVFDMPNTKPPVMDERTFRMREELLSREAMADYVPGFLVAGNCEEAKKGLAGFYKVFMAASTGGIFSDNVESDLSCPEGPVSVHAEDMDVVRMDPLRPPEAEIRAIRRVLDVASKLKKPVNICHVSTGKGIEDILRRGLPNVSFEVTPHHLFLTEGDLRRNPFLKVYPPLRSEEDRRTLWRHFREVPMVASDHAPHTIEDKEEGAAGIPGLETEVALLVDAFNRGLVSIADIREKMHDNPVEFFGLERKRFEVGGDADFTVIDVKKEWRVDASELYSRAGWSPWDGKRLKGKVVMTILRGEVVMEEDEVFRSRGRRVA